MHALRQPKSMLVAGGLLLALLPASAQVATADDAGPGYLKPGSCHSVTRPVATKEGGAADLQVTGTLCTPTTWADGPHAVDVLVHGGMYSKTYWDWPLDPGDYSYVDRTLAAGRATFAYDRLGVGASSHPLSARITFNADVYVLHQVVQWLDGSYPGVDVVGHSLGSVIVTAEAGKYNDVDRVVLTGLTHGHGLGFLTLPTTIYPALLDPEFPFALLKDDAGYVTTKPGVRAGLFYYGSADPSVISYDEAHKAPMSTVQADGAIDSLTMLPRLNVSDKITAPVLLIVGQQDVPFCNIDVNCMVTALLWAHELPYFAGSAGFSALTVPDTGHDLTLHPSAATSFGMINDWMTSD